MSGGQFEIEIKSLLGSKENADAFKASIARHHPEVQFSAPVAQLNHYFAGKDIAGLFENVSAHIDPESLSDFEHVVEHGVDPSIRTREHKGQVLLVIKASTDDTTSANGISRLEFEGETPFLTLDELDELILDSGFTYLSKWSRERQQTTVGDVTVCLDKNAGYGYVAEFEKVVHDKTLAQTATADLRMLMTRVGATELTQDRLERMFKHYNAHWHEYYGTDKTFTIT